MSDVKDWPKLAEHFVSGYFPTLGKYDTVSREELLNCVTEAMESASHFELPNEPLGDWVDIRSVEIGSRVVAPFNNGVGFIVGTVKICPYGSGNRVVSDGQSFVTPNAVKTLLQVIR